MQFYTLSVKLFVTARRKKLRRSVGQPKSDTHYASVFLSWGGDPCLLEP